MFTEEKVINYTWNYFRWRQETYIHQNEMNNKTEIKENRNENNPIVLRNQCLQTSNQNYEKRRDRDH